jgi:hypothetical protein
LWLIIDVADPKGLYAAIEQVIGLVRTILPQDQSSLAAYAVRLRWPTLLVVPLARGKALTQHAWRFSTMNLPDATTDTAQWWRWVPRSVDDETWEQLGVSRWEELGLELANQLPTAVARLWAAVGHLASLLSLPDVVDDRVGEEVLLHYVESHRSRLSEALQALLNLIPDLLAHIMELAAPSLAARPSLQEALDSLTALADLAVPDGFVDGRVSMTVAESRAWADKLQIALAIAVHVVLCLLEDASSPR